MLTDAAQEDGPVDFWLSGQLRIRRAGVVTPLGQTLLNEILALLLLRANTPVPVADIVGSVWPAGQAAEDSVRPYVSRIRKLLDGTGCEVRRLPRRYLVDVDPMRVDVLRFEQLLDRAERVGGERQRELIEAAMEVCPADTLLAGFTRAWVQAARVEHRARWQGAASRRNEIWLRAGQYERLVDTLRGERAHASTDQRVAEQYLLALSGCDRVAEAKAHFDRLVAHLVATGVPVRRQLREVGDAIATRDRGVERLVVEPDPGMPDTLPPPTGSLDGRSAELELIHKHASAWDMVRVVGIYGPPGIGKTSLATAYAHAHKADYPGGALFAHVGFARQMPAADLDAVLESFLRALGLAPEDIPVRRDARLARYRDLVRRKQMIVVIDDVGASEDAEVLLPTGPGSLAIVTSRFRLTTLTARHSALPVVLRPIDQEASIALLTRLAGGRSDWSVEHAAQIALACGGHPLALCLAAARIATRPEEPVAAVARALAHPGRRIAALDRYAEPADAAAEVIAWSYRALPEPTARAFRLFGLAPCASLDRAAAAALTGLDELSLAPLLAELVAAHLVGASETGRFGMLDLIAEYAGGVAGQVDSVEEREAALDRLYAHHRRRARTAAHTLWPLDVPPGQPHPDDGGLTDSAVARAWLDENRDDVLAAARHMAGVARPRHLTDLAESLFRDLDHGGFLDHAQAIQEAASGAAQAAGDEPEHARALGRLGAVLIRRGELDRASALLKFAVDRSAQAGERSAEAVALGNLGRVAFRRGAYADAIDYQRESLHIFRAIGERLREARTLTNLGIVHKARGELAEALDMLEQARAICDELGAVDASARAVATIADILRANGRLAEADARYQEAIDRFRELGDRVGEATVLSYQGKVRSDEGKHGAAIELHEEALRLFLDVGDNDGYLEALINMGSAALAAGQFATAVRCHIDAIDRASDLGNQGRLATGHACLALDYTAQADAAAQGDAAAGEDPAAAADAGADEAVDLLSLARRHLSEAVTRFAALRIRPPAEVVALTERLS